MMHTYKLRNIINLSTQDRYEYSIREFVKLEKVWAAANPEFWIIIKDESGDEVFPIWPHKEAAELCLLEEMKVSGLTIEPIAYEKFKEFCIPDMISSKILFGVFFNKNREALTVRGEDLLSDLEAEENEGV